mgnify:CR=1 FL=1
MKSPNDYDHFAPEWCPGCGNFDILVALKQALYDLKIESNELILVTGIGQASKIGFTIKCNLFDGLHGRALPAALGIRLANHTAKVVSISGDGCFFAEGGNHFIHTMRRNADITVLAGVNRVFGLTKGQAAPTSAHDYKTKIHLDGTGAEPLNVCRLALVAGATFIARGFSGEQTQLTELIKQALTHRGAAVIDIKSPCVSFNKINTYAWFKQRVQPLGEDHDVTDWNAAMRAAEETEERIPTGVIYRVERPVFGDHLRALQDGPIARRTTDFTPERVRPFFAQFK